MPKYRISAPFWDGRQLKPAGSVLEFAKDGAPPRSALLEEKKAAPAKPTPKED